MNVAAHSDDWRDHAACTGMNPDWWFPAAGQSCKEAVAVCHTCPVQTECLDYALTNGERFGIYGGTTARERKQLRRNRTPRKRQMTHGTPSGYAWHLAHHEQPCWACADANSRYQETTIQLRKEQR